MAEARILYLATDDGLIQLANPGRSDRWREVGRALAGQPVRVVAAAPHDPLLVVAATADAVHRSTNGGISWEELWRGQATALAFDEQGALYVGTAAGALLRSTDGASWDELLQADSSIKKAMAVVDQRVIFCVDRAVYEWTLAGGRPFGSFAPEIHLAGAIANPTPPQRITVVGKQGAETLPDAAQQLTGALVVLGGNEPVLLVGTQGALLRSVDGGDLGAATAGVSDEAINVVILNAAQPSPLVEVAGPQHVTALVNPPRLLDHVFAATTVGELWLSTDRGRTWATVRTALPSISDLSFARAV
jgi:photosystem II stability/assembly factor-like uncharacterized protein